MTSSGSSAAYPRAITLALVREYLTSNKLLNTLMALKQEAVDLHLPTTISSRVELSNALGLGKLAKSNRQTSNYSSNIRSAVIKLS